MLCMRINISEYSKYDFNNVCFDSHVEKNAHCIINDDASKPRQHLGLLTNRNAYQIIRPKGLSHRRVA